MERDERTRADDLDRYWDALLRSETPPPSAGLDADLGTLVARLHAAGSALPTLFPDPTLAWRDLRPDLAAPTPKWSDEESVFPAWTHPNGSAERFAEGQWTAPRPRRRGGRVLGQLATAALLLLTLAVGFIAMSQRVPETPDEGTWVPAFVRALGSAPGVSDTPLVETTFSPEQLSGDEKEAIYYQFAIYPGGSLPSLAAPFCDCSIKTITGGVGVEVVQTGTYTIRLQAPFRVQRAGSTGPGEEIPAGTEVTLAAGDAAIYPDYAASGDIRNAGDEPVTVIGVAIVATDESGTPVFRVLPGVQATVLTLASASDLAALPAGPLNVGLRRVTLPPGTSIGPYQPVGLQAMQIESGTILRNFLPAGESTPQWRPLPQLPGSTASFVPPAPGLRETLDVEGDQPAAMLVLIIEPALISAQSLAP